MDRAKLKAAQKEVGERAREVVTTAAERGRESAAELRHRLAEALAEEEVPETRRSSMLGKLFNKFTLGLAAGYVLGTRAGRERFEQIKGWMGAATENPKVQEFTERGRELITEKTGIGGEGGLRQSIREVMTAAPETVDAGSTVAEAARKMREIDTGAIVVLDEQGHVSGIVTDRDIAVRAVAEGKDPAGTKVGEVASTDLITLSPADTVAHAVKLMRERAVRRLPVVEGGKAVGIVSIGDLAVERDRGSALADITEAPAPKR